MVNSDSQRFASIGAMICALLCSVALAREPTLGLDEYAHRAWKFGDGFAVAPPIVSFAQTPDGYLWLGSHTGLWRFDGVKAVRWRAPEGRHLPDNWIGSLAVTHDGTLWISTTGGLVSWRDGKLTEYPALAGQEVMALLVDREGTVWAGTESRATSTGRLCAIRDSVVRCYGEDGSLGQRIYCLYEDDAGHLWFASSSGVWLWRSDKPKLLYPLHDPVWGYFQNLTSGPGGALLVSAYDGIREIVGGEVRALPLPGVLPQVQPPRVLTDRQGGLWLGTIDSGLRYVHAGSMESYAKSDGLSGDHISRMFEDREGNIWVATVNGLDEFWKVAVARFSGEPSLSKGRVSAVLADVDGSIWFATPTGLYRRKDGEMTVYRGPARRGDMPARGIAQTAVREIIATGLPRDTSGSLYQDHRGRIWLGSPAGLGYLENDRFVPVPGVPGGHVNCVTEDDRGNLWVAHRKLGLLRISPDGKIKAFGWAELGIGETWRIAFDPAHGGLWLGSVLGEIAFFADGQIRASYAGDAPGKRAVHDLRLDPDGTLWAATEGGLIRLRNGHLTTLSSKDGLPCDIVHATIDDGAGSYWLYTACGLVRVARSDLDAWSDSGTQGSLSQGAIRTLLLDASDGVVNTIGEGSFSPNVAKSSDGRLWFATPDGAMTVDPRHLPRNSVVPSVHIEQVRADRKLYDASPDLALPPLVRDLEIDYTALGLAAPERNQFRYKLAGHDADWQNVGNRRAAFYNDLPPGRYRFQVVAANNSGVWNEQGASLDFYIAPAYWQTNWFHALCVAAFVALLWTLYRLRLRQVKRQLNMTLDARVNERTRIARDLHDTLLQSFQGLLLRFQTVYEMLPPTSAKEALGSAIDQTEQAIIEGRDAVQGLRASTVETNDLAVAITRLGEELAEEAGGQTAAGMRVEVEGVPRKLQPIVRDEVYRIASEALRNAFRHAGAKQIEVELRYDSRQLRLRIRDDGKGIAPELLTAGGRVGHFGLHGMRERAKLMGGKLTVWTAPGSGTEIDLGVPAAHAYVASPAPGRSWLAEKLSRKNAKVDS